MNLVNRFESSISPLVYFAIHSASIYAGFIISDAQLVIPFKLPVDASLRLDGPSNYFSEVPKVHVIWAD